jgi:hypothetical protein
MARLRALSRDSKDAAPHVYTLRGEEVRQGPVCERADQCSECLPEARPGTADALALASDLAMRRSSGDRHSQGNRRAEFGPLGQPPALCHYGSRVQLDQPPGQP